MQPNTVPANIITAEDEPNPLFAMSLTGICNAPTMIPAT